jgi:cell fate regulator YaaT (PSP1 superfamily)
MPKVVGIKFKKTSKVYYFEAGTHKYTMGCGVIAETARGTEYGTVAMLPTDVSDSEVVQPLKPVLRVATEKDEAKIREYEAKHDETFSIAAEKIEQSKLDMKLVDVEYTFDGSKLVIYFTADGRVDFRELVKELASAFKKRIELRQIGARDECKMLGGIAPCGRACCCSDHMSEYAHVTIKMAKNQNLSLNPSKISGLCGRLMCCLAYENAHYVETNKKMPKVGATVTTADKRSGVVTAINQLKETVRVKYESGEKIEFVDVPLSDVVSKGKGSALDDVKDDVMTDAEIKKLID